MVATSVSQKTCWVHKHNVIYCKTCRSDLVVKLQRKLNKKEKKQTFAADIELHRPSIASQEYFARIT